MFPASTVVIVSFLLPAVRMAQAQLDCAFKCKDCDEIFYTLNKYRVHYNSAHSVQRKAIVSWTLTLAVKLTLYQLARY